MAVPAVGGIILCGGQSKRMGRSKALLPFGNEQMLQRVVRILSQVVRPLVVVAANEQQLPSLPAEIAVIHDAEKCRGPMQGLAAGLGALRGQAEAAYVSSCDAPFLQAGFVTRMIDLLGAAAICVPKVGGYFHPLAAVYRVGVHEAVNRLLQENRLATTLLLDEVPTRVVTEAELADVDKTLQSLRNVNSPEDYDAALREFLSALPSNTSTTSAAD
jgi:molybdenum cofactor guanylyltransferase